MTKLIVDLKSIENIFQYQVDGLIVSDIDFSCYNDKCFSIDEIKSIKSHCINNNMLLIVNIDKIIEEEELPLLYERIEKYISIGIDYYIYSDFAILAYFKKCNLTNKLIYDAKTMITNSFDAKIHGQYNSLVVVSNELSLCEIEEIIEVGNVIIEVYGYHQMFYSRRELLSTFSSFKDLSDSLENKKLTIKEELRYDDYPIFQSDKGTFVYTNYRYAMFKELVNIKDKLKMIRINSVFIIEEEIIKIISIYQKLLNNHNVEELYNQLIEINNNISSGYLTNKSVLLKEN